MQDLIKPILSIKNGEPVCSSLDVAKFFNKRHSHILRDIDKLLKNYPDLNNTLSLENSGIERKPKFGQMVIERKNPKGGASIKSRAFILNKDAFTLLAFGFEGKKAFKFKIAYIEAFNAMEQELTANLSNYEQYLRLLNKFNDGKNKASFFGRGLSVWRKSKKYLNNKLDTLQTKIQPCLPIFTLNKELNNEF